jgi:hypothetical protein
MIPRLGIIGPPSKVSEGEAAKVQPDLSMVTIDVVLLSTPGDPRFPVRPFRAVVVIRAAWSSRYFSVRNS